MSFSGESNIASWNDEPTVLTIALTASLEDSIYIYLPGSATVTLGNTTPGASILSSFQPNEPYVAIIIDANSHVFHETYLLDGYDGGKEVASVFQKPREISGSPPYPCDHSGQRLSIESKAVPVFLEVTMEQIYQFMSWFVSTGSKEFSIENSGPAKKDNTQRMNYLFLSYYNDPICREVLIGARDINLNQILQISDSGRDTKNR
ncbi:hypothetical protein MMC22_008522 [Lobaria immixta]|nr:hypothetical protein [Lobaria immixta]